ncbi:hypothetical protein M407DRAFT_20446 [Tulasnella calospora MUT 4182]|uniref:Glycoside hydrolase family 105 protein n=1 Tax=Tulasnella calospora MUT 4182 TaxID=1051891 RepID=A0A0C3MA31_9AGAM|nr:hypothetical protein M407DRAFT_20446 [Tulasnella calospora MUT 4182]
MKRQALSLPLLLISSLVGASNAQQLNSNTLNLVRARMNQSSTASWEIGTRIQTLIEVDFSSMSVFSSNYLTPTPPSAQTLNPVLDIARRVVNTRSGKQLVQDGSAADPASIGVGVLLGNWTRAPGANWDTAAEDQLDALLNGTPRSVDGAISHRTEIVQLWSDYVYMVPPFLAYYGVLTSNTSLISESYNQIKLYRKYLYDSNTHLWRHITTAPIDPAGPQGVGDAAAFNFNDTGYWSTGNGWAAAGMLRVLGTIKNSPYSKQFDDEQGDLKDWIGDVHNGMTDNLPSSGVFYNYADDDSTGADAASTALFAATVYRAVTLYEPGHYGDIVDAAERAREALYANNGTVHFDGEGWLQPVVNPNSFHEIGAQSPEGQAFVLQMDNNWKEWVSQGSKSAALGRMDLAAASGLRMLVLALVASLLVVW